MSLPLRLAPSAALRAGRLLRRPFRPRRRCHGRSGAFGCADRCRPVGGFHHYGEQQRSPGAGKYRRRWPLHHVHRGQYPDPDQHRQFLRQRLAQPDEHHLHLLGGAATARPFRHPSPDGRGGWPKDHHPPGQRSLWEEAANPGNGAPNDAAAAGAGANEPLYFAQIIIPKTHVYIGEAVPVEARIYVDARVAQQLAARRISPRNPAPCSP